MQCGAQISDEAAFCPKCGTKVVYGDIAQQPIDIPVHDAEGLQADEAAVNIQQIPSNNTAKANGGLRKAASIGSVLMWGSLLLLLLSTILSLRINPAIFVSIAAIGMILSLFGPKPLSLSTKIQAVVGVILIVVIIVTSVRPSGGGNDKYVQIVKEGTLDAYPQMTVGEAFDDFLDNPKWESGVSDNGERFVNVTGEILCDGDKTEIIIQFIVDKKDRAFQYNACEIDGIPQSDLIVWGLLETIYNGGSTSTESDSRNSSSPIGKTQSFDDSALGNMEVTLDYVQFVDGYQDTWGYNYPDEGFVYLWAAFTVKNIGTVNGSLPPTWAKLIYDGKYEYFISDIVSDSDLITIPPLSAPIEEAFVFRVPIAVMESDKSFVLNIDDGFGKNLISFAFSSGDVLLENSSSEAISGEDAIYSLDYRGYALAELLGSRREELDDIYGTPTGGTLVEGYLLYGGTEYHEYNDGEMYAIMNEENGTVAEISVMANAVKLNGDALDLTREELKRLFGEPSYEHADYDESGEENGYVVEYISVEDGLYLSFWFSDMNTKAYDLTISWYSEY